MKAVVVLRDSNFPTDLTCDYVGVDRGAYLLIKNGIIPKFTYGDFDSVGEEELSLIESALNIEKVMSEKDYTDTELALLDLTERGYREIDVYGALGGRIDHELTNIHLLLNARFKNVRIRLIDDLNMIFVVRGKKTLKNFGYKYISFIPLFNDTTLKLERFKYSGTVTTSISHTLTVSNEFLSEDATVETTHPVLAIYANDNC